MLALRLRASLASYSNAYAVAVQRRAHSGDAQFVTRTGDPLQPFRVSALPPENHEHLVSLVV